MHGLYVSHLQVVKNNFKVSWIKNKIKISIISSKHQKKPLNFLKNS